MKHLIKKISLMGGGGKKPKPKPATLTPPKIGDLSMASSYSYAEMLDLLSDGPIEGLVNQNGLVLGGKDALQGIYLDDTAVAVSNDFIVQSKPLYEAGVGNSNESMLITFRRFFQNLQNLNLSNTGSPFGFKSINTTATFELSSYIISRIKSGSLNYSLSVSAYKDGTSLIEDSAAGGRTLKNDFNFVNYFNLILSQSIRFPYSLNQTTDSYFNSLFVDPIAYDHRQLRNLFNSGDISHEKAYIDSMFTDYFGEVWRSEDPTKQFSNWANERSGINKSNMIYVIRPSYNDTITANVSLLTNGKLNKYKFRLESSAGVGVFDNDDNVKVYDFILPRINENGTTTGRLKGFLIVEIKAHSSLEKRERKQKTKGGFLYYEFDNQSYSLPISTLNLLQDVSRLTLKQTREASSSSVDVQKYNYSNILAEYRSGEEYQNPFKFFNNILIDKNYGSDLLGPFIVEQQIQKITENDKMLSQNQLSFNITPTTVGGSALEGSKDDLGRTSNRNFSDWNKNQAVFNETSSPIKHIVYNPNANSVFVTIQVNSLSDTASVTRKTINEGTLDAGSKFPAIVNFEIETGLINPQGVESSSSTRKFKIIALIESPTLIDIGNPDIDAFQQTDYKFITEYSPASNSNIFQPFVLPNVENAVSALDSSSKRYVKVTKLSTETNSTLINKDISLVKVTEIIPLNFTYPHSAIVATKIDSRSFSNIPTRTFDCKLKKVKVPSNYKPLLASGKDKRYYSTSQSFNEASLDDKRVYDGDWDGTFDTELRWTDNPAWILYDIITSQRYGLGQYIDPNNDVDIFDLYKIGRFCDAVDDDGYFVGVPDNAGGLEPRFSCNIMFNEGIKVFDALNTISALFRGLIYYNNSQINFVDDRPKIPIALFTNSNVKDGIFNYTNYRRDEQFNSIEVVYIDRLDNFLTKVEYVEDEDDIRKRGIFKKTINANGVTSRAMARRLGQHLIFQTIKENQSVSFTAGLESLLCKPGDLIIIEDELKSLKSNFGRVLSVNPAAGSIRLNEEFVSGQFTNKLTVYTPTGYSTSEELLELAQSNRNRLTSGQFTLTAGPNNRYFNHAGTYKFSRYSNGFSDEKLEANESLKSQYAFYTGANSRFCYFSTQFTGWVLATGVAFTNDNLYNKFIFNTGDDEFTAVNRGLGFTYSSTSASGRSQTSFAASSSPTGVNSTFRDVSGLELGTTRGLLDSDIALSTAPQITTFDITGITKYEYGCEAFVRAQDINYSLIPFIKEGSTYRFQRVNADDQIYKVLSIKEENTNEYSVICTRFDTGKYALIDNEQSIVSASNTYSYTLNQKIGNITYKTLSPPAIANLTTGANEQGFFISGNWNAVANARGYNVYLYQPNGATLETAVDGQNSTGVEFYTEGIGNYSYRVSAYGNYTQGSTDSNLFYDSDYSSSGLFLVYDGADLTFDRPFLSSLTIL